MNLEGCSDVPFRSPDSRGKISTYFTPSLSISLNGFQCVEYRFLTLNLLFVE